MARPRKDAEETPVEERIYQAFWELIQEEPFERISIGQLTERAACNRGTFYYYFTDIYDLLDKTVDRSFPVSIPRLLFSYFAGKIAIGSLPDIVSSQEEGIDKLCVLLNSSAAEHVRKRIENVAAQVWLDVFKIDLTTASQELRIFFTFMLNAMMGIMAYRAQTGMVLSVRDLAEALSPEIPQAFLKLMHRHGAL